MSEFERTMSVQFDVQQSKKNIREKNQQSLTIASNGGLFKITPEFILFLSLYAGKEIVVEDSFQNPIKITNTNDLLFKAKAKYQEVMNNWYIEYNNVKNIRKAK